VEKRYQVFVSSTFWDLEKERQEVMHALLELDCIPSGMELFPAANEDQWNLIKKVIDDCDYYVLIMAGRYGSIGLDGISYTEMEYRYALSIGKPTIAFLHRSPGKISADKTESSSEGKEKLRAFKTEVEKKLCKQWDTPQELGSVVSRSLIQLIKSTPAIGWVRANELADREAMTELLKLRRRVEELQAELEQVRVSAPRESEGLSQGEEKHELRFSYCRRNRSNYDRQDIEDTFKSTWNEIFSKIAPLMIQEAMESQLKSSLDKFIKELIELRLSTQNGSVSYYEIIKVDLHQEDFQTIKVQLRALGLISKSVKTRSVKDSGTYWTLTPYGDEVMTRLIAIRRD
jgi:Domain of unknown function (DUF4062)